MKRPTDSPSRRFHWRARDFRTLRRWEVAAWNALFDGLPEMRLWAAVFCDGIKTLYRTRSVHAFETALRWITAPRGDQLGDFDNLCEAIGVEPDDVRRDVLGDVRDGKTFVKVEL